VKTRRGGYLFAGFAVGILIVYLVAMVLGALRDSSAVLLDPARLRLRCGDG
jgi:hypothetical protein